MLECPSSASGPAALLPLWTGLLGGAIGVFTTWISSHYSSANALLEARASVVSSSRVKWADDMRTEIAEIVFLAMAAITDIATDRANPVISRHLDNLNRHIARAELLLDDGESSHDQLMAALKKLQDTFDEMIRADVSDEQVAIVDRLVVEVNRATRLVLKRERQLLRDLK